jgi:hypothetical protein
MKAWIGLSSIQGLQKTGAPRKQSISRAIGIAETPEALANYAIVLEKLHRGKERRTCGGDSGSTSRRPHRWWT